MKETEIKLAAPDAKTARRMLRTAGFRVFKRRVFEANTVFDTADYSLRKGQMLLRVREAGGTVTVTYKGKPDPGRHKRREEIEVSASPVDRTFAIFERLGFRPMFRYEKYRTELRQPDGSGLAMIDETPVGVYIELEGPPRWIDRTARELGFKQTDYILASYGSLYSEWCARERVGPSNMVF